jgi:hypothetical protein
MGCDREQHSKTNVYGRASYGYYSCYRATFQLCQSTRSIVLAVKGCSRGVFEVFRGTLFWGLLAKWRRFLLYRKTYYFGVQVIHPKKASFRTRQHHLLLHGDG